jgi:transposase-like protein
VHARTQHPNASLTPKGRLRMVMTVLEDHWSVEAAAERFQVDAKTVRKWRDRFVKEGTDGLYDRSSRPKSCPWATSDEAARRSSSCEPGTAGGQRTSPTRRASRPRRCSGFWWRTGWAASTTATAQPSRSSATSATVPASSSTST